MNAIDLFAGAGGSALGLCWPGARCCGRPTKSRAAVIAAWNTRAAPAVPPGWQLVPVEPTEAMLAAFLGYKPKDDSWLEGYRAMLAAVIVGNRTS